MARKKATSDTEIHNEEYDADLAKIQKSSEAEKKELQDQLTAQQKESDAVIADLHAELQTKTQKTKGEQALTVTHEEHEYAIRLKKFIHNGQAYTARDLQANDGLVAALVKKHSPILKMIK